MEMIGNQRFEGARRNASSRRRGVQWHVVIYAAALWMAPVSCTSAAMNAEQVFAKVSSSVVSIEIVDEKRSSATFGSGVIVGAGAVVTNCHVALQPGILIIKHGGRMGATLAYADEPRDLCLLNVPELVGGTAVLGSVRDLKPGQRVFAIGSPKGLELSISEGVISALRRSRDSALIQTTAAISPGSSGGGLFDDKARLVGITAFYLEGGQSLNFAIPADWIGRLRAEAARNNQSAQSVRRQPTPRAEPRDYGPIGFKDLLLGGSLTQHQQTYAMTCNTPSGKGEVTCRIQFVGPRLPIYTWDPKNEPIRTVAGVQVDWINLTYEEGRLAKIEIVFADSGMGSVVDALSTKFTGSNPSNEKVEEWAAPCRKDNFQLTWNIAGARIRLTAAAMTVFVLDAPLNCANVAWHRSKLQFDSDILLKQEQDAAKRREETRRKDL